MKPRRHALALLTAIAAVACFESPALASLPVFGGPDINGTGGYYGADITAAPASSINNLGTAVGEANYHHVGGVDGGQRAVWWTPKTWNPFPTGPDPASGIVNGHGVAVNNAGTRVYDYELVGSTTSPGQYAGRLAADGATRLDGLGASPTGEEYTRVKGLNGFNTAVGTSAKYIGSSFRGNRAVRWSPNSISGTELSSLSAQSATSYVESEATDVNDSNIAVGYSGLYNGNTFLGSRAVKWSATGVLTELGTLGTDDDGVTSVKAIGINNAGVIVGNANKYNASGNLVGQRGVRFIVGGSIAIELSPLSTGSGGVSLSKVISVSDGGLILGSSNAYSGIAPIGTRAVYWPTNGSSATALPHLGLSNGITHGQANSANADGVIAGTYDSYIGQVAIGSRAVIWTTAGTDAVIDLNTLLPANSPWTLTEATGISDTGFVSGVGLYAVPNTQAYNRLFTILVPQAGTYGRGDGNFDTKTNFDDLVLLAQHYNEQNPTQKIGVGDFDLNGVVDFGDLVVLAQNYNGGPAALTDVDASFAADWVLAQSLVPEPAVLVPLACLSMLLRRGSNRFESR